MACVVAWFGRCGSVAVACRVTSSPSPFLQVVPVHPVLQCQGTAGRSPLALPRPGLLPGTQVHPESPLLQLDERLVCEVG